MASSPSLKRDLVRALASEKKLRAKAKTAMGVHAAAKKKLAAAAKKAARVARAAEQSTGFFVRAKSRFPGYFPKDEAEITDPNDLSSYNYMRAGGLGSVPGDARRLENARSKVAHEREELKAYHRKILSRPLNPNVGRTDDREHAILVRLAKAEEAVRYYEARLKANMKGRVRKGKAKRP